MVYFFGGRVLVRKVLDPWTGSAILNILSTVCLPRADLPDMLSSRLAGDATSLRISPATREAPLHFLWINSHTVGGEWEERREARGTGARQGLEERLKNCTHSFLPKNNTLSTSTSSVYSTKTPSVRAWWVLLNAAGRMKRPFCFWLLIDCPQLLDQDKLETVVTPYNNR